MEKKVARAALRLPQDKQIILFGSLMATSDQRKGFPLLQAALQHLSHTELAETVEVAIFGASEPKDPPKFGFKTHYLGSFSDDLSLSFVYSAADIFVLPSVQENLANTVIEALACGVPCLAFDIGGMPDMIEHQNNGYLAKPYEAQDLAAGMRFILKDASQQNILSKQARESVITQFTLAIQAKRYAWLFQEVALSDSTDEN